jgi:hypothetical protein
MVQCLRLCRNRKMNSIMRGSKASRPVVSLHIKGRRDIGGGVSAARGFRGLGSVRKASRVRPRACRYGVDFVFCARVHGELELRRTRALRNTTTTTIYRAAGSQHYRLGATLERRRSQNTNLIPFPSSLAHSLSVVLRLSQTSLTNLRFSYFKYDHSLART